METNNNLSPVLQLRQDDVVAIPIERYEQLIDAETRLNILIQIRKHEIANEIGTYIRSDDHILGSEVMHTHYLRRERESDKSKEDADE